MEEAISYLAVFIHIFFQSDHRRAYARTKSPAFLDQAFRALAVIKSNREDIMHCEIASSVVHILHELLAYDAFGDDEEL